MKTILVIGLITGFSDQFKPTYAVEFETQAQCVAELRKNYNSRSKFDPQAYCVPAVKEPPIAR